MVWYLEVEGSGGGWKSGEKEKKYNENKPSTNGRKILIYEYTVR